MPVCRHAGVQAGIQSEVIIVSPWCHCEFTGSESGMQAFAVELLVGNTICVGDLVPLEPVVSCSRIVASSAPGADGASGTSLALTGILGAESCRSSSNRTAASLSPAPLATAR